MDLTVRPGPQEYICRDGSLSQLENKFKDKRITKITLIHGQKSWQKAKPFLQPILESNLSFELIRFQGECTYEEVDRLTHRLKESKAQALIAVGGGKLMDSAKYVAAKLPYLYSVFVPTLASNCAPWTPISVMYDENGSWLGFDIHDRQTSLLVIDPSLVINSPLDYFIAGIADTLAKWYESDQILSNANYSTNAFLTIARQAASDCRDNIFNYSQEAVQDFKKGKVSQEVTLIIETIIAISGLVGGFGDKLARTSLAHAVHDALTSYPESHSFLHGNKVAYGILVQLAYEGKWKEINKLSTFYDRLSLPKSLKDINIDLNSDHDFQNLTQSVINNSTLQDSEYEVTATDLFLALKKIENVD